MNGVSSSEKLQESAEKKDNSHSFKREAVEGSPFTKIYEEDHGWYLVMGDYRLTNEHETEEELEEFLKTNMWNIMVVMMSIVSEKQIQLNNKKLHKY